MADTMKSEVSRLAVWVRSGLLKISLFITETSQED